MIKGIYFYLENISWYIQNVQFTIRNPDILPGVQHKLRNLDISWKSFLSNKIYILFFERFEKEIWELMQKYRMTTYYSWSVI